MNFYSRFLFSAERGIGVGPAVIQKAPALADPLIQTEVYFDDQDFFFFRTRFFQNLPESIRDERPAPELQLVFLAHAVAGGQMDAVGDGVAPLNRLPGVVPIAVFGLMSLDPADGRGIKE